MSFRHVFFALYHLFVVGRATANGIRVVATAGSRACPDFVERGRGERCSKFSNSRTFREDFVGRKFMFSGVCRHIRAMSSPSYGRWFGQVLTNWQTAGTWSLSLIMKNFPCVFAVCDSSCCLCLSTRPKFVVLRFSLLDLVVVPALITRSCSTAGGVGLLSGRLIGFFRHPGLGAGGMRVVDRLYKYARFFCCKHIDTRRVDYSRVL